MRTRLVVMVMAGLLAMAASGAWTQPQSVSLELKGAPGSELKYEGQLGLEMEMTFPNPNGDGTLTVSPRLQGEAVTSTLVHEVAANGDLTLGSKVESFSLQVDVADFHASLGVYGPGDGPPQLFKLPELPVQTVVSKRGKVLAVKGLQKLIPPLPMPGGAKFDLGQYVAHMVRDFAQPLFPDKPVSVGESWEWKMTVDPGAMMEALGMPMPAEAKEQLAGMRFPLETKSTLAAFEECDGVKCAKIETSVPWELSMPAMGSAQEAPTLRESGVAKVITWFDFAAGRKMRESTDVSMDMSVTAGASTVARMSMKMRAESRLR